jgi:hypothetical protein
MLRNTAQDIGRGQILWGETKKACKILVGNLKGEDHLEDGRIILRWILKYGTDSSGSG